MINILKGEWNRLQPLAALASNTWVNVVDPSAEEITMLQRDLNVPRDFLTAALDADEKARTDREDEVQLVLLRVPFYHGQAADVPFTTIPLGIVITDHNVRETLAVVDRAYLLYEGKVLCEGTSDDLINDPVVRERYLGQEFRM